MKYLRFLSKEKFIVIIGVFILFCTDQSRAQIGIGLPAGEEPQSALDVRFDSAVSPGFLMPRLNSFPTGDVADGMMFYYTGNSEDNTYYVYHNGTWTSLAETAGIVPPDTQAPTAPSSLTASNPSSSTIDLSWTASTDNVGVSGYKIYFNDGTLATTSSGTSVTVTGLVSNTAYTFYATAYDAAGNESSSSNNATESTTSIPDSEAPSAPSSLVASNITTSSVDLSWGASTDNVGVAGYYVYQDGVQVSNVTSGTSTTISSLSESTQYSFYVTAYDAAGNESSQSNTVTPTTLGSCVASTICSTSFEQELDCWILWTASGTYGYKRGTAYDGTYSLEMKNLSAISITPVDLSSNSSLDIEFWYLTNGYESSDNLILQYRDNGGDWENLQSYSRSEGSWQQVTYNLSGASYMTSAAEIRILGNANQGNDRLYIDLSTVTSNCN